MFLVLHPLIQVPRLVIRAERKKELHLVGKCACRGEAGGAVGGRELFRDSRLEAALQGCRPSGPASLLLCYSALRPPKETEARASSSLSPAQAHDSFQTVALQTASKGSLKRETEEAGSFLGRTGSTDETLSCAT